MSDRSHTYMYTSREKHIERYGRVKMKKKRIVGTDVGRLSWLCQLQGFLIVCLFCTAYIKTEKSERERESPRARERERKRDKAKEFHTLHCLDKIEQERKTGSNC